MHHTIILLAFSTTQLGCDAPERGWRLGAINIAPAHVGNMHITFRQMLTSAKGTY